MPPRSQDPAAGRPTAPFDTPAGPYVVTVSREIPAPAQVLFDVVADPSMHPRIDGSDTVRAGRGDLPERLSLGATFSMDMRMGADYRITNTVVEFVDGERIGWRHFNGHVWRYGFVPVAPDRTLVVEQWDARPAASRLLLRLTGFPGRARAGMTRTLERLAEVGTDRAA